MELCIRILFDTPAQILACMIGTCAAPIIVEVQVGHVSVLLVGVGLAHVGNVSRLTQFV